MNRFQRAKRIVLLVSFVAALGGTALTAARSAPAGCFDVYLIWVRGSGQPQFFDKENQPQGWRLEGMLKGRVEPAGLSFGSHSLDYPADGGSFDFVEADTSWPGFGGNYSGSKDRGVNRLESDLADFRGRCPDTAMVLGGYSQGAHVIGDFLIGGSPAERDYVAFAALFGDPKFHRKSPVARGDTSEDGILEARIPYAHDSMENRMLSFCEATGGGDAICSNDPSKVATKRNGVHRDEYQQDRSTAIPQAVNAALLRGIAPRVAASVEPKSIEAGSSQPPVDIMFVIDTTGSMEDEIDSVAEKSSEVAHAVKTKFFDATVGLTQFRDKGDDPEREVVTDFTSDTKEFDAGLESLTTDGGGDDHEAALAGLQESFTASWRNGASKIAILITDNPFKDPDPITGATVEDVAREAKELDPVAIYPLLGLGLPEEQADALADTTDGQVIPITEDVGAAVVEALDEASRAPIGLLDGPSDAPPGVPVPFSAGQSFDPDSVIKRYEWDFDDDGVVDETTTSPSAEFSYAEVGDYLAAVTVTADDGQTGTGTKVISIRAGGVAPTPPIAPRNFTASVVGDKVNLAWQPPETGAPVTGYVVLGNGEPMFAVAEDTREVAVRDVPLDESVTFAVAADSDFGTGARSSVISIRRSTPHLSLSATSARPGESVVVTGSGFPSTEVALTLRSDPVVLGNTIGDSAGAFTFTATIPTSTATGSHMVEATAPGTSLRASVSFDVIAPSVQSSLTTAPSSNQATPPTSSVLSTPLVRSGADSNVWAAFALCLIALGFGLVRASRNGNGYRGKHFARR